MIKIVLIEDHTLFREGIARLLSESGQIEIVGEFGQARMSDFQEFLQYQEVDIILCDVNLPGINGIEFSASLKKRYPKIKIAILSMHKEELYVMQALEHQLDGYFHKDILRFELINGIQKIYTQERYFCQSIQNVIANYYIEKGKNKVSKPVSALTPREKEVILHISKGLTNREIAHELGISHRTVDNHRNNIFRKCKLKNTADLVRFAFENGLNA